MDMDWYYNIKPRGRLIVILCIPKLETNPSGLFY